MPMRLFGFPMILTLAISGCASVGTFVNSTSDVVSGRSAESVENARRQQAVVVNDNSALRGQLASLEAQKSTLRTQLSASQQRLRNVSQKLDQENRATDEQRNEYNRLVDKQRELDRRLAAASATPSPRDPAGASAQSEQLSRLAQEKDVLERQVNALQRAL